LSEVLKVLSPIEKISFANRKVQPPPAFFFQDGQKFSRRQLFFFSGWPTVLSRIEKFSRRQLFFFSGWPKVLSPIAIANRKVPPASDFFFSAPKFYVLVPVTFHKKTDIL